MRPSNMGGGSRGQGLLGPGPLMTSHLKVRDLDKELLELKRKRAMIQRDHQMLSLLAEVDRKREYELANRNLPNMFNEVWQPPPKRANGPHQVKPWIQDYTLNMSKPMPSNYIPSLMENHVELPRRPVMSSLPIVKPIVRNKVGSRMPKPALRVRNNPGVSSQSNKIMKNRPQDAPNRLNSYSVKERKDLVSKALDKPLSAVATTSKVVEKPDTMILLEDQIPSQRVSGRLELALGQIVKEIKADFSDNVEFQQSVTKASRQRVMKQGIRDRIRIVMLNQVVGPVTAIIETYRKMYPKETDKDIVDLVINYAHKSDNVIATEHPKDFFTKNIESILEKKLKEMSSNLLKMYVDGQANKNASATNNKLELPKQKEPVSQSVEAMKVLRSLTSKYILVEELDVLYKYYTELIENILEKKLPSYLPKCKEQFLEIFELDKRFAHIERLASEGARSYVEKKVNESGDAVANINDKVGEETLEKDKNAVKGENVEKGDEINDSAENEANENNKMVVEPAIENEDTLKTNKTDKESDITNINVKETTTIAHNNDAMKTDKAEEIKPETADIIKACPEAETPVSNKTQLSPATTEPKTPVPNKTQVSANIKPDTPMPTKAELPCRSLKISISPGTPSSKESPYFVKLIGRPKLPARPAICDFLNNYKPASIKKHKSINNLLVVGFNNEDDYNRILKANESVLGDITVIIKGNEKVIAGKENEATKQSNDVQKQNGKEINENSQIVTQNSATEKIEDGKDAPGESKTPQNLQESNDLIGPDLDDQITTLLTTIRETEEDKDEENSKKELLDTNDDRSQESSDSRKVSLKIINEDEAEDKNDSDKGTKTNDDEAKVENEDKNDSDKEVKINEDLAEVKNEDKNDSDKGAKTNEDSAEVKNEDKNDSDKVKGAKANVKNVATPVRSSSRLANITPSTIRTRRTSRLMQE